MFFSRLFPLALATSLAAAQVPVLIREGADDVDGISAVMTPDQESGLVTVEMTVARQSYVAFAFSLDDKMPDSLFIVGLPDAGTVMKYDANGYGPPSVSSEDRQTLQNTNLVQNETHTVMTFSKLLEEDGEPTVTLDGSNTFLYAMGSSNTYGYHGGTDRGSFNLDFSLGEAEVVEVKTYQGLWMAHGFMMALSWALLIPIGVGFSVFRKMIPGDGKWYLVHRTLNGVGLLLMTIGFFIAIYIIQQSGGTHFTAEIPHRLTGLFISLFGIAQGVWGFFRPHAPHPAVPAKDGEKEIPAEPKTPARVAFEYGHRILGVALLAVAWFNTSSGLDLFSSRFGTNDLSLAMWIVVAILAVVTVGLGVKQRI